MVAVILAGGMGLRLRPYTDKIPKCLIALNGKTLLERSLLNLSAVGIKKTIIVIGYLGNAILDKIGDRFASMEIQYVANDQYEETGSMFSLAQIMGMTTEAIILLESDLLYEVGALEALMTAKDDNVILMSDCLNNGDDVFICADEQKRVRYLGKSVPKNFENQISGSLVGISKLSIEFINKIICKGQSENSPLFIKGHYEENLLAYTNDTFPLVVKHCPKLVWTEIDNEGDYIYAQEKVLPLLFKMT